jgi:transcriptional regulator with XRE-family HTH domain
MISKMKLERIKKGMSQIDLCMKTDVPQWRISLIERGIVPKPEEAQRIAKALDCRLKDIFPFHDEHIQQNVRV